MRIEPREFIHPDDQKALEQLQSLPMFPQCVKGFMKLGIETMLEGLNMAQKIKLGPKQLPEIYSHLPPACEVLGIPEPEFYLQMDPQPNAYTMGDTKIFLTVTSGLVEYLDEDEMQAVVAHECGHIVCHHVLYHTMATMLLRVGSQIFGPLAALAKPVEYGLLYWSRRSELSADRAGAVVSRGPKPIVDTMIRLAGGPKSITGKINMELYTQQAEAYEKLTSTHWNQFLQGLAVMEADHPFLSVRTREINKWCATDHFQRILEVMDSKTDGTVCSGCGASILEGWKYCQKCGRPAAAATSPEK